MIKEERATKQITLREPGVSRASIVLVKNDDRTYALLEDVYVEEKHRSKGEGKRIVKEAIEEARRQGCYKLIATSRNERAQVHEFYKKQGFREHGKEFRIEID